MFCSLRHIVSEPESEETYSGIGVDKTDDLVKLVNLMSEKT